MAGQHLIIVGKSGVGRSTVAANVGAALAETGRRVLLIGYDNHRSSAGNLSGGSELKALPLWGHGEEPPLYAHGYRGALCLEAGGGVAEDEAAQAALWAHPLVAAFQPEFVLHDVAWEPCGTFRLPVGIDGVASILAVTSADRCALQAVNGLFGWLNTVAAANARLGGVVANNLTGPLQEAIVSDFAGQTGASVTATIPHSIMVSVSDFYSQTLLESAPFSHVTYAYRKLAKTLVEAATQRRPRQLDDEAMRKWSAKWGDIIAELETGVVNGGLGI
ncbi:ATPase [Geomonas subterranea]|uniref:ATPase n=1 Tax=Geomonas subterranea TaxID=2847989 RepID=A0ABX8LKX7_9BACT|nr:ATPase [Geomonas subterranea]QXE91360.1 ATPase [Geomonas subterranea]QXM10553.1 ATPase [Geomonas subterranea]